MLNEEKLQSDYVWNSNIYSALMNGNISRDDYPEKEEAIKAIQKMVSENGVELIDALLNIENWRSKTVAGFLIGFKNERKYLDQIGKLFLKKCGGVTGYCYTFAKFADEKSIFYLTKYLDQYLLFDTFPDEKFQDLVFAALRWIDKTQDLNNAKQYLGDDGLWTKFVNFDSRGDNKSKFSNHPRWGDLNSLDNRFEKTMLFYNHQFAEK